MFKYKVSGHIGEGAHGYVVKGINLENNKEVAMKKLIIKSISNGIPNNILREIKSLQFVDSQYVVKLLDVFVQGMGIILVMEYLPIRLTDIIRHPYFQLKQGQIKKYMKMLLLGVSYLHSENIMHRDLKPSNLLISSSGILKIADLGLARLFSSVDKPPSERAFSHQVATRWYRAPELLYGSRNYTASVDMWAVGCIFGEIINKQPLFQGETDIEQLAIVLRILGTPSKETWPGLTELPDYEKINFPHYVGVTWDNILPEADQYTIDYIKKFLVYNDQNRISAKEALLSSYFYVKPLECDLSEMPNISDFECEIDFDQYEINFKSLKKLLNGVE